METTKELSVHMQMYLEYEGNKTLEELENEFYSMIDEFSEKIWSKLSNIRYRITRGLKIKYNEI